MRIIGSNQERMVCAMIFAGSKWLALDLGVTTKVSKTSSVNMSIGGENSINDANYYTYYGRLTYQSMF